MIVFALVLIGVVLALRMLYVEARPDGPRALLTAATGWLPAARAEWGRAMLAELERVSGRRARWGFAVGCSRAVLHAALLSGRPPISVAAAILVVAGGTGAGIAATSPELRLFAIVFAVELAVCGWLAWLRRPAAATSPVLRGGVLLGVVGCVALCVYTVAKYPRVGSDPTHLFSIFLATVLTAYLWMGWSMRAQRHAGIGAAALATLWTVAAVAGGRFPGVVVGVAAGILLIAGLLVGRAGGARAGAICGLWMGLGGAVSLFVVGMISSLASGNAVDDDLGALIVQLLGMPLSAVLITTLGAMISGRSHGLYQHAQQSQ